MTPEQIQALIGLNIEQTQFLIKLGIEQILIDNEKTRQIREILPTFQKLKENFGNQAQQIHKSIGLLDAFVLTGLCESKNEVRRLIKNKGIYVFSEMMVDESYVLHDWNDFINEICLISVGNPKKAKSNHAILYCEKNK